VIIITTRVPETTGTNSIRDSTASPSPTTPAEPVNTGMSEGTRLTLILVGTGLGLAIIGIALFRYFSLRPSSSFRNRLGKDDFDSLMKDAFGKSNKTLVTTSSSQQLSGRPSVENGSLRNAYGYTYDEANRCFGQDPEHASPPGSTSPDVRGAGGSAGNYHNYTVDGNGYHGDATGASQNQAFVNANPPSPQHHSAHVDATGMIATHYGVDPSQPQGHSVINMGNTGGQRKLSIKSDDTNPYSPVYDPQLVDPRVYNAGVPIQYVQSYAQPTYYTSDGVTYQYLDPNQVYYYAPDGSPVVAAVSPQMGLPEPDSIEPTRGSPTRQQ
jgi:hypothetical protein